MRVFRATCLERFLIFYRPRLVKKFSRAINNYNAAPYREGAKLGCDA